MLNQVLILTRPLVLLDLETTGLDPAEARAVELGMRIHKPDVEPISYRTLIRPDVPIPKESTDTHGITDEMVNACRECGKMKEDALHYDSADGERAHEFKPWPTWRDLAASIAKGFTDCDFGGMNIKYDLAVAAAEQERSGYVLDYSTSALIELKRMWEILEPRNLTAAVRHWLGRDHKGAHGALADIEETEEVILKMLDLGKDLLPDSVKALGELLFPRKPNWIDSEGKFVFINGVPSFGNWGKHKGQPLHLNKSYLQWMYGASFTREVKVIIDRCLAGDWPQQPAPTELTLSALDEDTVL